MRIYSICLALATILLCPFASAQWVQTSGLHRGYVHALVASGTNLLAGTDSGVYLSTNDGTSWTAYNNGLTNTTIYALALSDTNLYVGTHGGGVFLSTNKGKNWTTLRSEQAPHLRVSALAISGRSLLVGIGGEVRTGALYRSIDQGTNWTEVSKDLVNSYGYHPFINSLAAIGANIFAGTSCGVFGSANDGTSWTACNTGLPQGVYVSCLAVSGVGSGMRLFAGTDFGVFRSMDNGTTWTDANSGLPTYQIRGPASGIHCFAVSGNNLLAGSYNSGVYLSTDYGTSWVSAGLTNSAVMALAVLGTNLFAGTEGSGLWRRPLSEMVTSVEKISTDLPTKFNLAQNYPNPFNPSTTITYELPRISHVSLSVYNRLGMEVATLVNEEKPAGIHTVQFNGSGLASGVYYYRLRTGEFIQTRKLVLVK